MEQFFSRTATFRKLKKPTFLPPSTDLPLFLFLLFLISLLHVHYFPPSRPAGGWRATAQPDGADGEDPGEEQEETPQDGRQHQEEAVGAGFQHLQRFFQCV